MDLINQKKQQKSFCFLQGPVSPFFRKLANQLNTLGYKTYKINLCFGDWIFGIKQKNINYRGQIGGWSNFIRQFYLQNNITHVLMTGEQREYHIIANQIARELGIIIIVTDLGYLRPDWITFELNGMSGDSQFPKDPQVIKTLAKTVTAMDYTKKYEDSLFFQSIWEIIYCFSSIGILRLFYPFYRPYPRYHPLKMFIGTGIHLLKTAYRKKHTANQVVSLINEKYFLFPLQMRFDFQIIAYSHYKSLDEAIYEVIQSFAKSAPSHLKLAIKEHPLDENIVNWKTLCFSIAKRLGIENRIIYFDGGNLSQMIEGSIGIITVNSTVGISALRHCKPTFVLGDAIYKINGLTNSECLDNFWTNPIRPDPELIDSFIKLLTSSVQIRGVYHKKEGLKAAVNEATHRLINDKVNLPI